MKKVTTFLIFAILPLWATAQDYNGEAEVFLLSLLMVLAPIFFLIGLPLSIKYLQKASQDSNIGLLRTAGWLFALLNAAVGLLWGYILYFFAMAGEVGDWMFMLFFLALAIGAFIPIVLMFKGEQRLKKDQPTSLRPK